VRMVARLGDDDFKAPPFSASALSAARFASRLAYGGYLGGHLDGFVQGVTARTGFAGDEIEVVGNIHTSASEVLDKLELGEWTSLIGCSAKSERQRVASLSGFEAAAVRKVYPHTLELRVEE